MNMIRSFPLLLLLVLTRCGVSPINIISTPLQLQTAQPADPSAVHMEPVNFRVITKENLDAFVQEMVKDQGTSDFVIIAFTTTDYENLALNLADLKRYIEQQKSIIVYYKKITNSPAIVVNNSSSK
jgi:hypothetical protein